MYKGLTFIGFSLFLFLATPGMAGEIDSQVEGIQSDAERLQSAPKKVVGKDSRLVPGPIPISNPTIGTGLAAAILYLHPTKN